MLYRYNSFGNEISNYLDSGNVSDFKDIINQIKNNKSSNIASKFCIIIYINEEDKRQYEKQYSTITDFKKWLQINNYVQFNIEYKLVSIQSVFSMYYSIIGCRESEGYYMGPIPSKCFFIIFPVEEKENFIKLSYEFLSQNN